MPSEPRKVVPVVCFYSDKDLGKRRAQFSGHMEPEKIKNLVINNMFEKVEYNYEEHGGDDIILVWKKEHNKLFEDLTKV